MSLTSLSLWISPRSSESEVVVVNSTWRVVSQPPERCRATTQQNMSTIWQCVCVSLCVCITWCHVSLWQKFCVQGQREILDFCQGSRRVGGAGAVVLLVLQLLQLFAYLLQHFCHSREPERKTKTQVRTEKTRENIKSQGPADRFSPLLQIVQTGVDWTSNAGHLLPALPLWQLHICESRHDLLCPF